MQEYIIVLLVGIIIGMVLGVALAKPNFPRG